jgi:sugar lactone lactonase YvrE
MYKTLRRLLMYQFLLLSFSAFGQYEQLPALIKQADSALLQKDYAKFYDFASQAQTLYPYSSQLLYKLGQAAALTGKPEESIHCLRRAITIRVGYDLENSANLSSLKSRSDFAELLIYQQELRKPIIHSDTAFVIHDRQLHPEGIAYSNDLKSFFVGSIHKRKIVRIDSKRKAIDFTPEGENGMNSVFGVKVDSKKGSLWVCTSPLKEMKNYDSTLLSNVMKYDLRSGKHLATYNAPDDYKTYNLGDLILDKAGNAYVSDSQNNSLLKVNDENKKMEKFFGSSIFLDMEGIAFSDDENYLFISDYAKGLFRLDMKTKKLEGIKCNLFAAMNGIDGLYFYKNSLIAIQNGILPPRVMRFFLDESLLEIVKFEILDRSHPAFGEPTLGVLVGENFYYIANSQWGGYSEDHQIKPNNDLKDIVVLKVNLEK